LHSNDEDNKTGQKNVPVNNGNNIIHSETDMFKLTVYQIMDVDTPSYVISNPQAPNNSDYFLFCPTKKTIISIDNALDFFIKYPSIRRVTMPEDYEKQFIETLHSLRSVSEKLENNSDTNNHIFRL
jgi:hypothetical protein